MESLLQDVRHGLRVLLKTPGVTAASVVILALGIGANTAIFSLAHAFLWSLLPVKDPRQLVFVYAALPNGHSAGSFPYSTFEQFRDSSRTLSGLFAYDDAHVSATVDGHPEYVDADFVSGDYFGVLGVGATLGRTFSAEDDQAGKPAVAVISDYYWERRFGRDSSAVGRTIDVGKIPCTIIGVTPPAFSGRKVAGKPADLVLPMFLQPRLALRDHDTFGIMARLRPGVTGDQARADLDVIYRRVLMRSAEPVVSSPAERELRARRIQLRPGLRGTANEDNDLPTQLPILLAVVAVVLLVASVNVANLMLSRATARQKEIAVRLAIGASRARLVRQLLTETILLGLLGGALGLLFAEWGVGVLTAVLSYGHSPIVFHLTTDATLLAFTAGVSVLTGLLFGLAPALSATRLNLTPMLKGDAGRAASRPARRRLAKSLVVSQIALSLALLIGAGLLIRTLQRLYAVDPGFQREKVLITWVLPALSGYDRPRELSLYRALLARIDAIPGVQSASLSRYRLVTGRPYRAVWAPGPASGPLERRDLYCGVVGPRYFATTGIVLRRGREFAPMDDDAAPKVAIISETMARTVFANEDPIGRRLGLDAANARLDTEIVGVVGDVKHRLVVQEEAAAVYVPVAQAPPDTLGQMNLVVRATVSSGAVVVRWARDYPRN